MSSVPRGNRSGGKDKQQGSLLAFERRLCQFRTGRVVGKVLED